MFGIKKYTRFAYRSPKWSTIRKEHLNNNGTCAACGRNKKLEVHHIEPVHVNPDRELDMTNLITLCDSPCHLVFGHLMDYKSWNPSVADDCQKFLHKYQNRPYKNIIQ
jgi:5-methylcytosine-specific restriction endonuclease McrA